MSNESKLIFTLVKIGDLMIVGKASRVEFDVPVIQEYKFERVAFSQIDKSGTEVLLCLEYKKESTAGMKMIN